MALVVVVARWMGPRAPYGPRRATRPRTADVAVVVMLLLLPAVQAAGTGNPLAYLAVNQFACWTALMVAACTMPGQARASRAPSRLGHRVRRPRGRDDRRRRAAAAPLPDRCLVRRHHADRWHRPAGTRCASMPGRPNGSAAVRDAVGNRRAGDPVMAFDEMAGVVAAAGRPLRGGGVVLAHRPRRERRPASAACARASGPWGDALPVVVYDRAPSAVDRDALRACGLSLSARLQTGEGRPSGEPRLQVYVPIGAEERTRP